MTEIRTKFLFHLALDVGAHHVMGLTPFGSRRVAPISGGTFEGPQLSGIVLPGGTDWIGPKLGEHNEEVYCDFLGMSRSEYEGLIENELI